MNPRYFHRLIIMLPLTAWLAACVGGQTFTPMARQGDTVALAAGWQKNLLRQNLTVTITPASGASITYPPNDPRVRSIINMYPDPVSRAVVGTMTKQDLGYDSTLTGSLINNSVTSDSNTGEHDNDWWQTIILIDLPSALPTGNTIIALTDSAGAIIKPASLTIVPGTGSSNLFNAYNPATTNPLNLLQYWPNLLASMERADRFTVLFNSYLDASGNIVIPHSIHMTLTHTPNVGKTWVVNPRGDLKNVVWNDDGSNITVMLTPANGATLKQLLNFKFYIAGGITGLTLTGMKAYDINGNLMPGITASVQ